MPTPKTTCIKQCYVMKHQYVLRLLGLPTQTLFTYHQTKSECIPCIGRVRSIHRIDSARSIRFMVIIKYSKILKLARDKMFCVYMETDTCLNRVLDRFFEMIIFAIENKIIVLWIMISIYMLCQNSYKKFLLLNIGINNHVMQQMVFWLMLLQISNSKFVQFSLFECF